MENASRQAARFDRAMVLRRRQWMARMALAPTIAILFTAYLGWVIALVWSVSYIAMQTLELVAIQPERTDWTSPRRRAEAKALIIVSSAVFGSLAPVNAAIGGGWGAAVGMLILAGALLNTAVHLSPSPEALKAAAAPLGVCVVLVPLAAWLAGGPVGPIIGLGMASLMYIGAAITSARAIERGLIAAEEAQFEIERRRSEAEAAVEAKSSFVAMIAHELRTPLGAIVAGSAALERSAAGEAERDEAALISQAGEMMNRLLSDLLDLSKLEAGRMTLEAAPYDLQALVGDLARLWAPRASQKRVAVKVIGAEALPQWVTGDSLRLRQILNNLMSNALKFTERGQVTLKVEIVEEAADRVSLNFIVSDTGPGLPPQEIERIFIPFDQGGAGVARTHGGTGLGLPISRELAQLLGGDLVAANDPGGGAVFTLDLTLPLAEGPVEDQPPAPALATDRPPSILVVDDHEMNRRAMKLMLEPLGVEVFVADSGIEALRLLHARSFDAVIMDVHMPMMDGLETTRRLRGAGGPNREVPVIAATGATEAKDREACRSAGMTGFIAKPVRAAELFAALQAALADAPPAVSGARVA